jgi:hypothetical protein
MKRTLNGDIAIRVGVNGGYASPNNPEFKGEVAACDGDDEVEVGVNGGYASPSNPEFKGEVAACDGDDEVEFERLEFWWCCKGG